MQRLAELEPEQAQRWGRRLSAEMAVAWTGGLLQDASGRGAREALVAELWSRRGEPGPGLDDGFELLMGDAPVGSAAAS
jgi:hypothetical protein